MTPTGETAAAGKAGARAAEAEAVRAKSADGASDPERTGGPAARARRRRVDPEALAALAEERDFLLRSLDDLEREHAAGDVDEHDYETLKDDYTARAARAIRAIESHQARVAAARRPRSWRRTLATVAGVAAFAVLAGVLVAQASGRRESGDALTGEIRQSTREQLVEAHNLAAQGDYAGAIETYDEVLGAQPANAEALAYRGWAQFQSGDASGAVDTLTSAVEADSEYPDSFAFLAIILYQAGAPAQALDALDRFEALDPPPAALDLVAGLRDRLETETGRSTGTPGSTGTTSTTGPPREQSSPTSILPP